MSFRSYEIPEAFRAIPPSLTLRIFALLTPEELCWLCYVSKWFRYFATDDSIWRLKCTQYLGCQQKNDIPGKWKAHYIRVYQCAQTLGTMQVQAAVSFDDILAIKNTPALHSPHASYSSLARSPSSSSSSIGIVEAPISSLSASSFMIPSNSMSATVSAPGSLGSSSVLSSAASAALLFSSSTDSSGVVGGVVGGVGSGSGSGSNSSLSLVGQHNFVCGLEWQRKALSLLEHAHSTIQVNKPKREGDTVFPSFLYWATSQGADLLVRWAVDVARCDISICDAVTKQTPLHHAVWLNLDVIVDFLLERRSDPNNRDQNNATPLHAACWNGNQRIVELLLNRRAEINARDSTGRTPAHAAASNGHTRVLQFLSDHGSNMHDVDNHGYAVLHCAARYGRDKIVEMLVKKQGIDVSLTTKDDEALTALHLAARHGHHRTATLLVQLGADINASSLRGTTAIQEASKNGEHQTVQVLRRLRNNSGTRVSYAYSPLDSFESTTSPAESGCIMC